jgi:MoxR-like ATPase
MIQFGASPRAGINLVKAAKAHAFLAGRAYVLPEDIKAMAHDTLRHRLIPTYQAEADGVLSDHMLDRILSVVPVP